MPDSTTDAPTPKPTPTPVPKAQNASVAHAQQVIHLQNRVMPENAIPGKLVEHTEQFATNVIGGVFIRTARTVKDPVQGSTSVSDSTVYLPGNHFVDGKFVVAG